MYFGSLETYSNAVIPRIIQKKRLDVGKNYNTLKTSRQNLKSTLILITHYIIRYVLIVIHFGNTTRFINENP